MTLAEHLKAAVQTNINDAVAEELKALVAQEVRRAFREHNEQLTAIVQAAVAQAITEMQRRNP